jgi:hypothetical protein
MWTRSIAFAVAGAGMATAMFLACGNDTMTIADAAVDAVAACDCPAAEPPLAGRIYVVEATKEAVGTAADTTTADCSTTAHPGGIALGGSCRIQIGTPREWQSTGHCGAAVGGVTGGWCCAVDDQIDGGGQTVVAQAICYDPSPLP